MPAGHYVLGARDVVLDATTVRLATDGRLASSAPRADEAIRERARSPAQAERSATARRLDESLPVPAGVPPWLGPMRQILPAQL